MTVSSGWVTASGVLRLQLPCEGKRAEPRHVSRPQSKENMEKESQKAASLTLVTQDHPLSSPRSAQATLKMSVCHLVSLL